MGKTGETCQTSGPYKCSSHAAAIVFFKRGDKFSSCPFNSGHSALWTLVQS